MARSPGYYGSRPKSTDRRRAMVVRKFWAGRISDRLQRLCYRLCSRCWGSSGWRSDQRFTHTITAVVPAGPSHLAPVVPVVLGFDGMVLLSRAQ